MRRITPAMWARIPWHAKAQLVARLDAEIAQRQDELDRLANHLYRLGMLEPHPDYLRLCHAAYGRGVRTDPVIAGERAYQRNRKRRSRAAGLAAS